MLVLAALLYVGTKGVEAESTPRAYVGVWLGVLLTMTVIVMLALVDLHYTRRLRRRDGNAP